MCPVQTSPEPEESFLKDGKIRCLWAIARSDEGRFLFKEHNGVSGENLSQELESATV